MCVLILRVVNIKYWSSAPELEARVTLITPTFNILCFLKSSHQLENDICCHSYRTRYTLLSLSAFYSPSICQVTNYGKSCCCDILKLTFLKILHTVPFYEWDSENKNLLWNRYISKYIICFSYPISRMLNWIWCFTFLIFALIYVDYQSIYLRNFVKTICFRYLFEHCLPDT